MQNIIPHRNSVRERVKKPKQTNKKLLMASGKIPATVIIVTLTLLIYFTTSREWHQIDHLAPESAPANSPDYAPVPLSGGVIIGDSEPSPSMYEKKIVASNNCGNGGSTWGGYGGQNYGGGMGGSAGSGGMRGMTGTGGMQYSGGGLQRSAAGIASSFVGHVPFSVALLVTGLMYLGVHSLYYESITELGIIKLCLDLN